MFYGPTWRTNDDGEWALPEYTLGWQIAGWCSRYLLGEDGKPWNFTDEQLRFILWWYAVDKNGRFIYRKGVLQRLKGWGKDPLLAVICLVEFVGPCLFSHWVERDGEQVPVGKSNRRAWVQIAAVSRDQTRNTASLFPALMSPDLKRDYGIKDGLERIRANHGRQVLEVVTSSPRALEGGRVTFVVLNETHHWVKGNNGDKMYETIDGNATKMDKRYLAITNAYLPGEDSVAERMRDAYEKILEGRASDIGFLYDSIEAHPSTPLTPEALRIVLPKIRGDATWLNIEAITQSVLDLTIAPSRSRRMWLNQIVAEEDALYGPDQIADISLPDSILEPGQAIVLGFDGGKTDDDTALVAIRVSDNVAFVLHHQYRPDGPAGDGWEVDRRRVDSAVHDAFQHFDVQGFYADVALWESYITEWAEQYSEQMSVKAEGRNAIAWDMRQSAKRVTMAHERLMRSIFDQKLFYDGDPNLRRHALNARRHTNIYGVSFRKETPESPKKVDLYAALMLAHEALYDLRTRGKKVHARTGQGFFL